MPKTKIVNREPVGKSKTVEFIRTKITKANKDNGFFGKKTDTEIINEFKQFVDDVKRGVFD